VLNVKVPRKWQSPNNAISLRDSALPNAVLVDWHAASRRPPGDLWKDGLHFARWRQIVRRDDCAGGQGYRKPADPLPARQGSSPGLSTRRTAETLSRPGRNLGKGTWPGLRLPLCFHRAIPHPKLSPVQDRGVGLSCGACWRVGFRRRGCVCVLPGTAKEQSHAYADTAGGTGRDDRRIGLGG